MIFCPFRALIHCIDTVLDKRHDVNATQKTKQSEKSFIKNNPKNLYGTSMTLIADHSGYER
jgi:hypothetical protein